MRHSPPRRAAGFTLLEVIVVLVIGAIMYALMLGVPGRGTSTADLKASARSLASGLRTAQTTAMATRRDALLTLDLENHEFEVPGVTQPHKLPDKVDLQLYTAESEIVNDKRGSIRFYPDGSSTGGRITVSSGERKYLVDVDWLTGRVTVED